MYSLRQRFGWFEDVYSILTSARFYRYAWVADFYCQNPSNVILDVGANIGLFTKALRRVRKPVQIFCFEPSAYSRSLLEKAKKLLRWDNVKIIPKAVSDRTGVSELQIPVKKSGRIGHGGATLIPWRKAGVVVSTVETTTLDDFVQDNSIAQVNFIKVDIEGFEMRFIKGAQETLRAHRPGLMLELKDQLLKADGYSLDEAWALLSRLDYVPFDIEEGRFTVIEKPKDGRHIVWHPREKSQPHNRHRPAGAGV